MSLHSIVWCFMVVLWGCSKESIQPIKDNQVTGVSLLSCKYIGSVHNGKDSSKSSYILQCKGYIKGCQSQGSLAIIALPRDVPLRQVHLQKAIDLKKTNIEKSCWDNDMFVFWKKGNGGCAENLICTLDKNDYLKLVKRPYYIYMLFSEQKSGAMCCSYEPIFIDATLQARGDTLSTQSLACTGELSISNIGDNDNFKLSISNNQDYTLSYLASISAPLNDAHVGFILVKKDTCPCDAFRRIISSGKQWTQATLFKDVILIPGKLVSNNQITAQFKPDALPINYSHADAYGYIEQNNSYVFVSIGNKVIEFQGVNVLSDSPQLICMCQSFSDIPSMPSCVEFKLANTSTVGNIANATSYILILKTGPSWDIPRIESLLNKMKQEHTNYAISEDNNLLLLESTLQSICPVTNFFKEGILDYKYTICKFSTNNQLIEYTNPKKIIINIEVVKALVDKPRLKYQGDCNKEEQLRLNGELYSSKFGDVIQRSAPEYCYGFLISKQADLNVEVVKSQMLLTKSGRYTVNKNADYIVGVYDATQKYFTIKQHNVEQLKQICRLKNKKNSPIDTNLKIIAWVYRCNNPHKSMICSKVKELSIEWEGNSFLNKWLKIGS